MTIFKKTFQVFRVYWKSIGPRRFRLNNITTLIGRYISNDNKPSVFNTLCDKLIQLFMRLSSIAACLIIISHMLFAAIPLYFIVFKQIRITPMCLEIPFFGSDSDIGFVANLCVQGILGLASMLALIAIEIPICSVFTTLISVPELIHLEVDDMNHDCISNGKNSRARVRLRNIIVKAQDFIE